MAAIFDSSPASAQVLKARSIRLPAPEKRVDAPDFPAEFQWLNSDKKLALKGELKGRVVVLDFWTFCCINCIHVLPDLSYLEHKYKGKPVTIIGVHSAKFDAESDPKNITPAIQRYRIEHPVLVDVNHQVWNAFTVRSWPTFVVIDSEGRFVGQMAGEGKRELLDEVIDQLLEEGKAKGTLSDKPLETKPTALLQKTGSLAFPGKIAADPKNNRLVISDSNNDRVVIASADGKVQQVIGSGKAGLKDGSFAEAQFFNPQGVAVEGNVIYVADTDNHALRKIDLDAKTVTTLAGTGQQSYDRSGGGKGTAQGLSSPWDVTLLNGKVYIAMAGTHQVWSYDPKTTVSERFAGSGVENIVDGPAADAALAQTSGITSIGDNLYFADSEVSAIRRASSKDGAVDTLIGKGLFEFGFIDGPFESARLQHCLGVVAEGDDKLLVADTYNNALREIDLKSKTIKTLLGGPKSDDLAQPSGVALLNGVAYITDTNHHRVVKFDLKSGKAEPFALEFPK
jgi:DNA-binding beta-propeller fold protein YncE/thiol-disulfide isomerase/thioredoxin